MPLAVGTPGPDFTLISQSREKISLDHLKGRKTMLMLIPFPNARTCDAETCQIRDNWAVFEGLDANVVVITTHAVPNNKVWAEENGFNFPILADYWPHGAVAQAYDSFDTTFGCAKRTTYFLDADGVIRQVVATNNLGQPRPFASYPEALAQI